MIIILLLSLGLVLGCGDKTPKPTKSDPEINVASPSTEDEAGSSKDDESDTSPDMAPDTSSDTAPDASSDKAPVEETGKPGFTIELIFPPEHRLSDAQVALVRKVAQRWESIFVDGIPDSDFSSVPFDTDKDFDWGTARSGRVVIDGVVDDVAVMVTTDPGITGGAWGGVHMWRAANGLPIISYIILAESLLKEPDAALEMVLLHEFGHTLGFGTAWTEDLLKESSRDNSGTDTHFVGPLAVAAFDAAGGKDYGGKKVPVAQNDDGHWRGSVFGNEIMASNVDANFPYFLSAITIQSFADMGYKVDVTKADPYQLP